MSPTSRKSCFVIASKEVPVGPFFESLRQERIEPFFISDFLQSSNLGVSALRSAFRSADIVVAFLVPGFPSDNVIFEIGVAVGLGRPLMIFSSREISLPLDLAKLQVNYVDLSNLENAIPSITKFYESKEKGYLVEKIANYGSPPEKPRANLRGPALQNELRRIRNLANTPVEFERSIAGLLANLGWTVAEARPDARTHAPDMAIWIDELQKDVGNPLAVEIKSSLNLADVGRVAAQLTRYLETTGAKAGLILYCGPDLSLDSNVAQNIPPILAVNFDEFAVLLEQERFPAALKASFAQAKRSA